MVARSLSFGFAVVACAAFVACAGEEYLLGFDRPASSGGSGNDGGTTGVAGAPGVFAPRFAVPRWIEAISSDTNQDDPVMTADGLELFFASKRDDAMREDIWVSRRASTSEEWGEPELVAGANSEERESAIGLSSDGLSLWIGSDRDGGLGGLDVWFARRASREEPFSEAVHVPELSTEWNDLPRSPTADGRTLPLSRTTSAGDSDLFLVELRAGPSYGVIVPIAELNTSADESDPALGRGGLWIVFASKRDDPDGDLYFASRASLSEPFGEPVALTELNSDVEESDPWLSEDGSRLLFASRRTGQLEVYETTLEP